MPAHINTLLEPISESSPCGDDMLFSADFDAIQNARRFDDPSLDQGEWVTDIKEANWPFVVERSTNLLKTQTKDLRLAVWLTEGLAIEEGVTGLTDGYGLITGLSERYWEHLHPLPEGDDAEYRLGNVAWLVGRTAELLRAMPLTGAPFYSGLLADLKAFEAAMLALEQELDRRAGDAAPSFRQAKDAYEGVYRLAERFAREQGVTAEAAAPKVQKPESSELSERTEPSFKTSPQREEPVLTSVSTNAPGSSAGIQNRAQAVAQLRAVARFFRSTEPHNPAAYFADKAAECADMPLHQWLSSVVKDDGSLAHIRELLGVKPEENS
jgi:type VI secretion system protein ImpA